MSTKIHTSAGYGGILGGTPTAKFHVRGADLGFLFEGNKREAPADRSSLWVGGVFGDTFDKTDPNAPGSAETDDWRSPVMGRTSNTDFLTNGIQWDNFAGAPNSGGRAKDIWPYRHVGDTGRFRSGNFDAFTVIPNDIIQVPDGRYFGMGFRVENWVDPARDADRLLASPQSMCWTISNAWFWSDEPNAEEWQVGRFADDLSTLYEWGSHEGRNQFFQNASFLMLPGDDQLYVFGSREGRKVGTGDQADGIYLRRAHYDQCFSNDTWEYWGFSGGRWQWGRDVQPTPILRPITPGGFIGELNVQLIADKVVLTYDDTALGAVALVADRPDGVWSDPTVLVSRTQSVAQYAPSAHPWNRNLEDAYLHLSSWASVPNPAAIWDHNAPATISLNYCAEGWRVNLISDDSANTRTETSQSLGLDTSTMSAEDAAAAIRRVAHASVEANPNLTEE